MSIVCQKTRRHVTRYLCSAPPYLTQGIGPANVDAVEEDDVRFDCDVSGVPKPTITWTVNGRLVAGIIFVKFFFSARLRLTQLPAAIFNSLMVKPCAISSLLLSLRIIFV